MIERGTGSAAWLASEPAAVGVRAPTVVERSDRAPRGGGSAEREPTPVPPLAAAGDTAPALQRVLLLGDGGPDLTDALADLGTMRRVIVELASSPEDLRGRLASTLQGLPVASVIVAGATPIEGLIDQLEALWSRRDELDFILYHAHAIEPLPIPADPRLILVDTTSPPHERQQLLGLALRNARLARSLVLARTERTLRPVPSPRGPRGGPGCDDSDFSHRDPLTGLGTRGTVHVRIEAEIQRLRRDRSYQFALLVLNLNRFKVINDTFGPEHADALLIDVGKHLQEAVRQSDHVARMGADEFAIVLSGPQESGHALAVAQRLIRRPLTLSAPDGRSLSVTAAVGGVVAGAEGPYTVADLLRKASLALSNAKARGGPQVDFFRTEAHARDLFERDLEPQILRALRNREFSLYHQPVVAPADGRIHGFEALLRWHHPRLGLVPPGTFIPMLESSGLIVPLGEWIATQALADLRTLQGVPSGQSVFMNVNVSHRQLMRDDFSAMMLAEVRRSGLDPRTIGVELTETAVIDDFDTVSGNIKALRAEGLRVVIDDFGVGYSSLATLSTLPVDGLKVDRSFVAAMRDSPRNTALVQKIIEIGHVFDLPVVAEGIETRAELEAVAAAGCDLVQGYYFGRPSPLSQAMASLADRR